MKKVTYLTATLSFVLASFFISCNNDSEPLISPSDPNGMTRAISISGATLVKGTLRSSTPNLDYTVKAKDPDIGISPGAPVTIDIEISKPTDVKELHAQIDELKDEVYIVKKKKIDLKQRMK